MMFSVFANCPSSVDAFIYSTYETCKEAEIMEKERRLNETICIYSRTDSIISIALLKYCKCSINFFKEYYCTPEESRKNNAHEICVLESKDRSDYMKICVEYLMPTNQGREKEVKDYCSKVVKSSNAIISNDNERYEL